MKIRFINYNVSLEKVGQLAKDMYDYIPFDYFQNEIYTELFKDLNEIIDE